MNYLYHILIYLNIYIIISLSLNIAFGYCGLMTLAHAGYFAVAGYTYAIVSLKFGLGFLPALVLAVLVTTILSLLISIPSWRFRGDYFLMMSLAVQVLLFSALYNWSSPDAPLGTWKNLTNGPFGIAGVPRPVIFDIELDTIEYVLVLATVLMLVSLAIAWLLGNSPWGRLMKAVRDDELAARGLGKNARMVKTKAMAVSCGLVAIAGVMYVSHVGYMDPSSASLDESILIFCMVLVGGAGNIRGPVLGAITLVAIPEILRFLNISDASAANIRLLAYGLLLVIMMRWRPQGLGGEYRME